MNLISKTKDYLNKFIELGVLLLAISVIAEILFGPNVPFFGSLPYPHAFCFYILVYLMPLFLLLFLD